MNQEALLRSLKDDIQWALQCLEDKQNISLLGKLKNNCSNPSDPTKRALRRAVNKIDAQLADPDAQPRCGLYLHDGARQYGYDFKQLQYLVDEWYKPESVFHKQKHGFPTLLDWLWQISGTSIGDLHGDMFRHVVATYHYPADMTDEEYDALQTQYDEFWKKAEPIIQHQRG